ncbi:hypothetical protein AJ78_05437 [Emergomyces pasteurianus Ep9510]|uniref:Zn(2)-C6 fungal-type domain-containing protein n=1 Tax=Emergomyces pasteurianus Ep9510 TaxID=1447872 RepID=A0A1J9QG93_9EURO|nr:hypothetical protein AJ78_05437 [Emergomyces pasteurianus Ep9510]
MKARRSRGGCLQCLQQHRKCDEGRPRCDRCTRLNISCEYKKNIRWVNGPYRHHQRKPHNSLLKQYRDLLVLTAPGSQLPNISSSKSFSSPVPVEDERPPHFRSLASEKAFLGATTRTPNDETSHSAMRRTQAAESTVHCQGPVPPTQNYVDEEESVLNENKSTDRDLVRTGDAASSSVLKLCAWKIAFQGNDLPFLFPNAEDGIAYAYFLRSVAMIMPACDSTQNGYRQLATLALSTPVLMGTIISISTTYMHLRGGAPMFLALQSQSRALAALRDSLGSLSSSAVKAYSDSLKRDVLATILLQITFEMANGGSGAKSHLTYAWSLFRELGYDRRKPTCSIDIVLVQRITWIDTISSILWQRRPLLPRSFWFFNYNQVSPDDYYGDDSQPTVQETTGCPQWVISCLARISHLCADYNDGLPLFLLIPQVKELEIDLNVSARNYFHHATPPYTDLPRRQKYLDIVGQCFYWSAVLLLQRSIFRDPRDSVRVQSGLSVLIDLLESLPIGCGPDSALSLPLYLAASEAIELDHRARIKNKSHQLTIEYPSKTREALALEYEKIWADIDQSPNVEGGLAGHPESAGSLEECMFSFERLKKSYVCVDASGQVYGIL